MDNYFLLKTRLALASKFFFLDFFFRRERAGTFYIRKPNRRGVGLKGFFKRILITHYIVKTTPSAPGNFYIRGPDPRGVRPKGFLEWWSKLQTRDRTGGNLLQQPVPAIWKHRTTAYKRRKI